MAPWLTRARLAASRRPWAPQFSCDPGLAALFVPARPSWAATRSARRTGRSTRWRRPPGHVEALGASRRLWRGRFLRRARRCRDSTAAAARVVARGWIESARTIRSGDAHLAASRCRAQPTPAGHAEDPPYNLLSVKTLWLRGSVARGALCRPDARRQPAPCRAQSAAFRTTDVRRRAGDDRRRRLRQLQLHRLVDIRQPRLRRRHRLLQLHGLRTLGAADAARRAHGRRSRPTIGCRSSARSEAKTWATCSPTRCSSASGRGGRARSTSRSAVCLRPSARSRGAPTRPTTCSSAIRWPIST